jgi:hypothetical protein
VQAAGLVGDQLGQRVQVCRLELRVLAPLLDLRDDLVLRADRLEDPRVGREARLAAALLGQAEHVEEDVGELLGRTDRELLARERVDLRLELGDSRVDLLPDLGKALRVELQTVALHLDQDVDERQLDLLEQPRQPLLLQALALALGDHARYHRALGQLVAALDVRREALLLGQLDQRVAAASGVDQVCGDHRVMLERRRDRRVLGARNRLPVVGDYRPVAPRKRERGERLRLPDHHLVAGVGREPERRRAQPAVLLAQAELGRVALRRGWRELCLRLLGRELERCVELGLEAVEVQCGCLALGHRHHELLLRGDVGARAGLGRRAVARRAVEQRPLRGEREQAAA